MNDEVLKPLDGFVPLSSLNEDNEVSRYLKEARENRYPQFNTVTAGKGVILPQVKIAHALYQGREKTALCFAVNQGGEIRQVTFHALYGRGREFYLRQGGKITLNNLIPYHAEWDTTERNEALIRLVSEAGETGVPVIFGFIEGSADPGRDPRQILTAIRDNG